MIGQGRRLTLLRWPTQQHLFMCMLDNTCKHEDKCGFDHQRLQRPTNSEANWSTIAGKTSLTMPLTRTRTLALLGYFKAVKACFLSCQRAASVTSFSKDCLPRRKAAASSTEGAVRTTRSCSTPLFLFFGLTVMTFQPSFLGSRTGFGACGKRCRKGI